MTTVFFVDTNPKAAEEWEKSPHNLKYPACPFTLFSDVTEIAKLITKVQPGIVAIASSLGTVPGMRLYHDLRMDHNYKRTMLINAPQGKAVDDRRCTPDELCAHIDWALKKAPPVFTSYGHTSRPSASLPSSSLFGTSCASDDRVADAFNEFGDVKCPACSKEILDVIPSWDGIKETQVICTNAFCSITFTARRCKEAAVSSVH